MARRYPLCAPDRAQGELAERGRCARRRMSLSAAVPPAGHTCAPRDDLARWPVVAGVMTQYDFECN